MIRLPILTVALLLAVSLSGCLESEYATMDYINNQTYHDVRVSICTVMGSIEYECAYELLGANETTPDRDYAFRCDDRMTHLSVEVDGLSDDTETFEFARKCGVRFAIELEQDGDNYSVYLT